MIHLSAAVPAVVEAASKYDEQPVITDWPMRIAVSVLFIGGLTALALWGMRRGWRNRQARQADVPVPPTTPPADTAFDVAIAGRYLGAARAGDWLDRIAVHELGIRAVATAHVGPSGIWLERVGASDVWLPRQALVGARVDRGVAGTVRQRDRVLIVQWQTGTAQTGAAPSQTAVIDLGFRADERAGHAALLDECVRIGLLASAGDADDSDHDSHHDSLGSSDA